MEGSVRPDVIRFDAYEMRLSTQELFKNGLRIKLAPQAFQILHLLVERQGELVTREQLHKALWSADTFVDFDHGLNNAIKRIRDVLNDSPETPRYIETLPRLGYRFIGELNHPPPRVSPPPVAPPVPNRGLWKPSFWAISLGLALAASLLGVIRLKWPDRWPWHEYPPQIKSLAVLPIENLSGDASQDYFADGMTDELITMLAKNSSLRVTSRTSVMLYKRVHRPVAEIARELGVDGILEGSVARSSHGVHMTAQLIYAPTDSHVWAESYDRELSAAVALPREMAQAISKKLRSSVMLTETPPYVDPQAHDAYLLGRYYWFEGEMKKSRQNFQEAIDLQPNYAAAWSGLADYYIGSAVTGKVRPQSVMPQGEAAARKALDLDDSIAEGHISMAAANLFYEWDWAAADHESARAVELNPSSAQAHHLRSYVLRALNRIDESLREQKKAMELDPFAEPDALGWALVNARQFDAALHEAQLRSQAQPNDAGLRLLLCNTYIYKGMQKEAIKEWVKSLTLSDDQKSANVLHRAFNRGGFRAALEWELERQEKLAALQYVSPLDLADASGMLGRREETLRYLEASYTDRVPHLVHLQTDPNFDFVHSDPRYCSLIAKMGLPPAY